MKDDNVNYLPREDIPRVDSVSNGTAVPFWRIARARSTLARIRAFKIRLCPSLGGNRERMLLAREPSLVARGCLVGGSGQGTMLGQYRRLLPCSCQVAFGRPAATDRSEEHTSELQSLRH